EVTNQAIEEHLNECENCSMVLEHMKSDIGSNINANPIQEQEEIDYLKKIRRRSRIPIIILSVLLLALLISLGYLLVPISVGGGRLTAAQKENLCKQFAKREGETWSEQYLPTQKAAGVKIFGMEKNRDDYYIYGYMSSGTYVKFKGKAYEISGGSGPFKVKVRLDGDKVSILEEYGDEVTEDSTMEEFPVKYYLMATNYEAFDEQGYCKVMKIADRKVEQEWGVKVEHTYTMSLEEDGKYEVYDLKNDGPDDGEMEVEYLYRGKLKKIK
ncbi:MAG: hypothetical protein Q4E73_04240, partial [Lachnospiraceae bacterium]|nr:hypothetical protein [Lachnospiraceae bacterium]